MTRLFTHLNKFINTTTLLIMCGISIFLLLLNFSVSGYTMIYVQEIRYIYGISLIPFLIFLLIYLYKNKVSAFINKKKKFFDIFFYCYIFFVSLYLCQNCTGPNYDAQICLDLAQNFKNLFNASYDELYYIMQYPFNISMILFDYISITLSSKHFMLILYGINICCLLLSYYYLEKIFLLIYKNNFNDIYFKLISLLWIPPLFMTPFIYGWLYGISLIILSLYNLIKYANFKKIGFLIMFAVFLSLGIFFKLNYAIYGIAIILGICFEKNNINKTEKIKLTILTVITIVIGLKSPTILNEMLFETPKNSSSPISLHIMMTNYREDNLYIPGWVDGTHEKMYYNATREGFTDASIRANDQAIIAIKSQIKSAINNPTKASKFYLEKLASGWACKDFGIFNEFEYNPRMLTLEYSFATNLLFISIQTAVYLIFFGFFKFCVESFKTKQLSLMGWILGVGFIGFFLYHLISEIQSRYVIIPILMIIPLSVLGLTIESNKNSKCKYKKAIFPLAIVLSIITSFNQRYVSINNCHNLRELVEYDISKPYSSSFTIKEGTNLQAINIMLAGTGTDDLLEIVIYDELGNAIFYEKFPNIVIEAYWWNLLDIQDIYLEPGIYSITFTSQSNNIKLLVDYNSNSYYELLKNNFQFTTIRDLRYIKPNNIFK